MYSLEVVGVDNESGSAGQKGEEIELVSRSKLTMDRGQKRR